jgi:hypothetical protein
MVTFDALGNATFAGTVTADKINAIEISGLNVITSQLSTLADTVSGLAGQTIDLSGIALLATDVQTLSNSLNTIVNDVLVLKAEDAEFETRVTNIETALTNGIFKDADGLVSIDKLMVLGPAVFQDGLTVDSITATGEVINFMSDTEFFGTPYFTADTAGFAVIETGAREVAVVFDKPYLAQPIVNATITLEDDASGEDVFNNDIRYVVTRKSVNGFTILLNKNATSDIKFSWTAFIVKDPNVFFSLVPEDASQPETSQPSAETPEPEIIPEPEVVPEPEAEQIPVETLPAETIPEPEQ